MSFKVSFFDVGVAECLVVGEAVVAGDKWREGLVIGADDFLVRGKQQHLMGGHREVTFDEVAAV